MSSQTNNVLWEQASHPFQTQVREILPWTVMNGLTVVQMASASMVTSIICATATSSALIGSFMLLRRRNTRVYSPKPTTVHTSSSRKQTFWHYPPTAVAELAGVDATVFLLFLRMCRGIFLALTAVTLAGMLPVLMWRQRQPSAHPWPFPLTLTPLNATPPVQWMYVAFAYILDLVVIGFVRHFSSHVARQQQQLLSTHHLHDRLLITQIPDDLREPSLLRAWLEAHTPSAGRTQLIVVNAQEYQQRLQHEKQELEALVETLSRLRDRSNGRWRRMSCLASGTLLQARAQRLASVQARLDDLQASIEACREVANPSSPLFAHVSYDRPSALSDAYRHLQEATPPVRVHVEVAHGTADIIARNLALRQADLQRRATRSQLWICVTTVAFLVPNVLIAIFLSTPSNLGLVWPGLYPSLEQHTPGWAIVQSVVAPLVQMLCYMAMPRLFRGLAHRGGHGTRVGREVRVMDHLFGFLVVNKFVAFTFFAAVWSFVTTSRSTRAAAVSADAWRNLVSALVDASTYWTCYQIQQNIGTCVDLAQLSRLLQSWWRRRQRSSQAPAHDEAVYFTSAEYYSLYLFAATVGFSMCSIQPLGLVATAVYFAVEVPMKQYLILHVFTTRVESGGAFWKPAVAGLYMASLLSNLVTLMIVATTATGAGHRGERTWMVLAAVPPAAVMLMLRSGLALHLQKTYVAWRTTR